jgi:hypothetical protein
MVRRLLASVFLAAFPVLVIPIAVTSMGARAGAAPPAAVQQCKHGGWQTLTDASGQPFRNQGRCISYLIHNPVSLADLDGSFTGTQSFTSGNGCPFVNQVFDATYPGSSAVGSVALHLDGCVNPIPPPGFYQYIASFAITTSVGTLAGSATGPITSVGNFPGTAYDFELTLSVLSRTGAFAATTGTIHVFIEWPFQPQVTGSVSVP